MSDTTPRIYVASLSDYNNSILHGDWIDCDGTEDMTEAIEDILATSPLAQCEVCGIRRPMHDEMMADLPEDSARHEYQQYAAVEEWAIHDYEGFGSVRIHEYEDVNKVAALGQAIVENGAPFLAFLTHDDDPFDDDVVKRFHDSYVGTFKDVQDFAMEHAVECGDISDDSRYFSYIDWAHVWKAEYDCAGWNAVYEDYETTHIFSC